jgi:hypothetical protein
MTKYLLSVHAVEGEVREPMTEEEMKATGAWVFSGRLHKPDTATVVRISEGEVLTTDGPFAESKEHLGGFYIIEAEDLDAALAWASKVTERSRQQSSTTTPTSTASPKCSPSKHPPPRPLTRPPTAPLELATRDN